nr:MAG TPA: hypothetical protein [Caudoviricetes sp.]
MFESTNQLMAELKVLEYKLDKIRLFINTRKNIVDPIVRGELENILLLISKYEIVPADWKLETPLVTNLEDMEENENV